MLAFLGRLMFSFLFLASGVMKLQQYDYNDGGALMASVEPKFDKAFSDLKVLVPSLPMTATEVKPFYPRVLLAAIALELAGGALFVFGSPYGAYCLLLFLLPVTGVMHDFWNETDPDVQQIEMVQFMKNVVMVGALLFFLGMRSMMPRHM